eukprot:TRINITY_DN12584_c2_g1_i3.p2 TRINITY_DN12584_c2_g1~~TRINITY_DN12584_c2_g1_i3.p2  ORF type:complete len:109 (-),score=5.86 TRINITY_DN12584_c2_g1_i3:406-732(-)
MLQRPEIRSRTLTGHRIAYRTGMRANPCASMQPSQYAHNVLARSHPTIAQATVRRQDTYLGPILVVPAVLPLHAKRQLGRRLHTRSMAGWVDVSTTMQQTQSMDGRQA